MLFLGGFVLNDSKLQIMTLICKTLSNDELVW